MAGRPVGVVGPEQWLWRQVQTPDQPFQPCVLLSITLISLFLCTHPPWDNDAWAMVTGEQTSARNLEQCPVHSKHSANISYLDTYVSQTLEVVIASEDGGWEVGLGSGFHCI